MNLDIEEFSNTKENLKSSNSVLDNQKMEIFNYLQKVDDVSLLLKVKHAIVEIEKNESKDEYDEMLEEVLSEIAYDKEPLKKHVIISKSVTVLEKYERFIVPFVFSLALFSLTILGLYFFLILDDNTKTIYPILRNVVVYTYWGIVLLFAVDFSIILYLTKRSSNLKPNKTKVLYYLLCVLLPPLRLGTRQVSNKELIWLPFWSWSKSNYALFDNLRLKFSLPMIFIALLVIPILIVEWKLEDDYILFYFPDFPLHIMIKLLEGFIWIAFAFEFIIMIGVSNEKLDYCKENWIDLIIILLPMLSFVRSLRPLQALRVNSVAKSYRLRGIFMKVRDALILAEAVQKILYPNPNKHLISLRKGLQKNQRQRQELERLTLIAIDRIKKKRERKQDKKTKKTFLSFK